MTFEAQFAPGAHLVRVRTAEENERAFLSATSHSRLVALLRKALPAIAVVMFAGYFISTRLNVTVGGVTASVSGIEVSDGKLRMVNPTLKGVDKKKGAYVISADYADQDMANPKLVQLHAIKAELTPEQLNYAASDVLHLHALREKLDAMLVREGREHLARACFAFLPTRVELDLGGWTDIDPFAH